MSTIAFKDGILASDSACLQSGTSIGKMKKVYRVGKCLIGLCGETAFFTEFVDWFRDGADDADTFPWTGDWNALVVSPNNPITLYDNNSMTPLVFSKKDKYIAIGSGMDIALGCLYNGGSAKEAVQAAIKHNSSTKGPVRTYKV